MSQIPNPQAFKALRDWWDEMGVPSDERLVKALLQTSEKDQAQPAAPAIKKPRRKGAATTENWVQTARQTAAACKDVPSLAKAISDFDGCPLKEACNSTVVYDGVIGAPVMVIGEGPGRDEDLAGKPFVGRAGQLLDRMLASIHLTREKNALITNVNYWRPPRNRNPQAEELMVCRPFVDRMIELAAPKLIIAAGAVPAKALLASPQGIMKLRGTRQDYTTPGGFTVPLYPIFHPAYLLRQPKEKARSWRDLLEIEAALAKLA